MGYFKDTLNYNNSDLQLPVQEPIMRKSPLEYCSKQLRDEIRSELWFNQPKEKAMNYQFTERQLYKLLDETIKLYRENIDVHGQEDLTAQREAVTGTLEGLDAEVELLANGEKFTPTFTAVE